MSKGKSGKNLPYIPEIILDPSSSTPKEFAKVLQRIIIKWIDFDNEHEVSKQTFDFICRFDGKLQETPLQIDRDNDENFNDLCLRTLPFFTHLKEEDKRDVLLLQERINKITINSPNTEDDHFSQEVLHNTYSLISLLIKINSLIDWKDDTDSNCIRIANQFVHNCYEYLIVTIKDPQIRECVWRFDSNFLSICWNNKLCNYCHSTLIRDILSKSQIERFNLDSIDVFKGVLSKIGNLLEWVDDTFVDDTDQEIKTPSKFDRKIEKDDYRILEYFIKNNGTELSEKSEDTEQLWDIQKCEENDSDNENYPS